MTPGLICEGYNSCRHHRRVTLMPAQALHSSLHFELVEQMPRWMLKEDEKYRRQSIYVVAANKRRNKQQQKQERERKQD